MIDTTTGSAVQPRNAQLLFEGAGDAAGVDAGGKRGESAVQVGVKANGKGSYVLVRLVLPLLRAVLERGIGLVIAVCVRGGGTGMGAAVSGRERPRAMWLGVQGARRGIHTGDTLGRAGCEV